MTRSRLAAAGLLLAVFGLGSLAGGVGVSVVEHGGLAVGTPQHGREGMLARLTSELELSGAQQDSIRGIFRRHEPAMDSMWREVRPQFDSLRGAVRDEIRVQLTPDQGKKYAAMIERRDREYRERRSDGRD